MTNIEKLKLIMNEQDKKGINGMDFIPAFPPRKFKDAKTPEKLASITLKFLKLQGIEIPSDE